MGGPLATNDGPDDRELLKLLGRCGNAFFGGFNELRDVQRCSIAPITEGHNLLVASATASGKTEAVIAPMLARLVASGHSPADKVTFLLIAPTRALVNDLYKRLEVPVGRLGLSLGRQTSDHRDKGKHPYVLITTPESFDSMLVRDGHYRDGRLEGHLLAGVDAVFIDEAHLFDGTARGDQLCWLMGRLRRLRKFAGRGDQVELHACGATATVSAPHALARRLLGADARSLSVPGIREIDLFGPAEAPGWRALDSSMTLPGVSGLLTIVPQRLQEAGIEDRIWQALSTDGNAQVRKALVFVPTRSLCDKLSAHLARTLTRRRDIRVLAHHGSLERGRREDAEKSFSTSRDAVLVATTTLEVGIDIGDVDMVVLVGAPPGTRSVLQRIGRAGRRIGRTRVLAIPRTPIERAAFSSMLIAARDGQLEPETYARRWSVFVQQAASFIAQGPPKGRRRTDFLSLVDAVWPDETACSAEEIIEKLLAEGLIHESRGRLTLGESWSDAFKVSGTGMHSNFDSVAAGLPVVDAGTGEVIAHVGSMPSSDKGIALAGQTWNVVRVEGEIVLSPATRSRTQGEFRYAARSGPTGLEYAVHVQRGVGLAGDETPVVSINGKSIWMHFGGSAYQAILLALMPSLKPVPGFSGLAVLGRPTAGELRDLAAGKATVRRIVSGISESLEPTMATGPYQKYLPEACRKNVVEELVDLSRFRDWIATRCPWDLSASDARWNEVIGLFAPSA
jgi:ATP-dependent helicase Lhr and Lhr-like helicase